ncbi:hypothetical protein Csa_003203 [Cucumis sativus]|nr:hypothetical protein Csa_003203 [Cucumis sativus]
MAKYFRLWVCLILLASYYFAASNSRLLQSADFEAKSYKPALLGSKHNFQLALVAVVEDFGTIHQREAARQSPGGPDPHHH